MRVLVGCEESQAVTKEFRKLGYNAYSCDLLPESGGHPEWHIQGDIFKVIENHPEIEMGRDKSEILISAQGEEAFTRTAKQMADAQIAGYITHNYISDELINSFTNTEENAQN